MIAAYFYAHRPLNVGRPTQGHPIAFDRKPGLPVGPIDPLLPQHSGKAA